MDVRFRSWTWVGPGTPPGKRKNSRTFKAEWSATLDLLDRELYMIGAQDVVIECGLRPQDIRLDGWPKAKFTQPDHPGVRLSFGSKFGPLQYATDTFETFETNLRAIALALEALRKVDRYGVSNSGEQYRGWRALPSGSGTPTDVAPSEAAAVPMSRQGAAQIIAELASMEGVDITPDAVLAEAADGGAWLLSRARRNAHPDTGGTDSKFRSFRQAESVLTGQKEG